MKKRRHDIIEKYKKKNEAKVRNIIMTPKMV